MEDAVEPAHLLNYKFILNHACYIFWYSHGMLKLFFLWYSILGTKNSFFSIIVYQPTRETALDRRQVRMMSPAVHRQRADSLTFCWWSRLLLGLAIVSRCVCSSSGAFVQQPLFGAYKLWRAEQSPARVSGIVDQRLLRLLRWRTGDHQLRRDKADIKRHPAAVCLIHSPSQITANY